MYTLIVNGGSSSIKYELFDHHSSVCAVLYEKQGGGYMVHDHTADVSRAIAEEVFEHSAPDLIEYLSSTYSVKITDINKVCYRVVHGGTLYHKPTLITQEVLANISALSSIAPLHNPIAVKLITMWQEHTVNATHIAVFDTAFHHTIPERAYTYAIPLKYRDKYNIRRYGFHGISYSSVVRQLRSKYATLPSKIIVVHLGSGCSMAAIRDGKCIDTTMGFGPLEGLMMSTRPGDVDDSAILHLEDIIEKELVTKNSDEVETRLSQVLNKESGLQGIAGIKDMRDIIELASLGDAHANLAIDMFIYKIQKYIGSFYVILGGCETLVFTGGMGSGSAEIRKRVVKGLAHLNIILDMNTNNKGIVSTKVSTSDGADIWIMDPKEEEEIEIECRNL